MLCVLIIHKVSKDHGAFETSGYILSMTQRIIPEDISSADASSLIILCLVWFRHPDRVTFFAEGEKFIFWVGRMFQFRRGRGPQRFSRNVCGAKYTKSIAYSLYLTDWKSHLRFPSCLFKRFCYHTNVQKRNSTSVYISGARYKGIVIHLIACGPSVRLGGGIKTLTVFKILSKAYCVPKLLYCCIRIVN